MLEHVSPALADAIVTDEASRDVRVGDLFADKPAVLVFLRHFG
jgi:hypothetical protein